jgi:hypothetical protein
MKKLILIFHFLLFIFHFSFAQQYGWTDISHNLPEYPYDTTIINNGEDTLIANLSDVYFIDDEEGWVTTWHAFSDQNAAILHTNDGGETWEVQTVMRPCQVIHMIDENVGYAGSDGGLIFKTTDGGNNWSFYGLTGAPITGMSFPPGSDTGYVCSYMSSNLQQITPEGINPVDLGDSGWWKSISAPSHKMIWIGVGVSVYTFDEQGLTDQPTTSATYNMIDFARNDLGWGCGYEGVKDRNPGVIAGCNGKNIDWVHLKYTERPLSEIFALDENHVWAAGFEGYIYYSDNASQFGRDTLTGGWWSDVTFVSQPNPRPDADFLSLFFTSPQNGFASGGNNILLKYAQVNSVKELPEENFTIFQNPTSGKFKIQNSIPKAFGIKINEIEVVDFFGNVVMVARQQGNVEGEMEFDIGYLPAGVYFVRIALSNSIIVKKIVNL